MEASGLMNLYNSGERKFVFADLRGADLRGANLKWADLRGANLRGANLNGVNFGVANLNGAYLMGASLWYADLRHADLHEANLHDADLRHADFRGANLKDIKGVKSYQVSPTGTRYTITAVSGTGIVYVGCISHPIEYWLENYESIARKYNFTGCEIETYGRWARILAEELKQ